MIVVDDCVILFFKEIDMSVEDDRKRLEEIKKQVDELNLEAEKILLANQNEGENTPEGYGRCEYNRFVCACNSYVHGDQPGHCGRTHCGHAASYHAF